MTLDFNFRSIRPEKFGTPDILSVSSHRSHGFQTWSSGELFRGPQALPRLHSNMCARSAGRKKSRETSCPFLESPFPVETRPDGNANRLFAALRNNLTFLCSGIGDLPAYAGDICHNAPGDRGSLGLMAVLPDTQRRGAAHERGIKRPVRRVSVLLRGLKHEIYD